MNTNRWRLFLILAGIIVLVFTAGFGIFVTRAQADFADQLAARLAEQGVPVESVVVSSRLPFAVEINLQSQATGDTLDIADTRHMSLAQREAALAYRAGTRLDSVRVNILNTQGEAIFGVQDFFHPEDPSQQLDAPLQPALSDREMETLVRDRLGLQDLPGVAVERLEVSPMETPGGQGQKLELVVRGLDFSEKNDPSRKLFDSFLALQGMSRESGSSLLMGHLQILNQDGKVALDLVIDWETGGQTITWETGDLKWLYGDVITGPLRTESPELPPVEAYP